MGDWGSRGRGGRSRVTGMTGVAEAWVGAAEWQGPVGERGVTGVSGAMGVGVVEMGCRGSCWGYGGRYYPTH